MKRRAKSAALVLWTLLAAPCAVLAAVAPTPFTLIGPIEKFILNAPGDPVCGAPVTQALTSAKMTVHGVEVLIPCNLIIQMPATYLTADDVFKLNPGGPGESGLALADTNEPLAAFEATIVGNIVTDSAGKATPVAGLVYISQHSLATGAGYIKAIDLTAREMRVGADPAAPVSAQDARVRINDAKGVYDHHPPTPPGPITVDRRFTVDTENPTVHAATGYPMCLPSGAGDPECPTTNRVMGGQTLRNFVMGETGLPPSPPDALPIPPCPACDATRQAPFMMGDYVAYSGTLAKDVNGIYISAHTIVANVGIFTQPVDTSKPAYVSVETSLVGTMGPLTPRIPPTPGTTLPQETQDRLKIEGFTTDPARNVEIYAIDTDPVTGEQLLRLLNVVRPQSVPFGRFRLIVGKRAGILFDATGNVRGATRELMVHIANPNGSNLDGQPVPTGPKVAHGLVAGQYVAPVGEYIFPENTVLGDPLVPNNFECVAFLQRGSGPLTTNGHTGPVVPRLAPWPGPVTTPALLNCSP
jgi:hypothetical protein